MAQASGAAQEHRRAAARREHEAIAVIGPNADEVMTLVGNYYGTPSKPVTLVQGVRNAVPSAKVLYARGVDLVEGRQDPRAVPPIPSQFLRPAAGSTEQGLKGEYFKGKDLQGQPVVTRVDRAVNFRWDRLNPTTELVLQGQLTASRRSATTSSRSAGPGSWCRR